MSTSLPKQLLKFKYDKAAQDYERSLTLEHYMEATPQATQRKITVESLDLVHADRSDVQVFNELLVQYPVGRGSKLGQEVPDNMVVICEEPIEAIGSFNLPFEPAGPFWVLEYVSKYNKRKDYEDSFRKYERELKVPYCLMFYPDGQELSLFRRGKSKYISVKSNPKGRFPVADLDIEVAMVEGWVRFWYKGELLPLPAELQEQLNETKSDLRETKSKLLEEQKARMAAEEELAQLRAQIQQMQQRQSE